MFFFSGTRMIEVSIYNSYSERDDNPGSREILTLIESLYKYHWSVDSLEK